VRSDLQGKKQTNIQTQSLL